MTQYIDNKPSFSRKAIAYTVIAAMLHTAAAPAIASTAQKKQREQLHQNSYDDNAVAKMIELSAKHELNIELIKQNAEAHKKGRTIFTKMVDGVIELFTDNSEELAIQESENVLAAKLISLENQMHKEHIELMQELKEQTLHYKASNMPTSTFVDQAELINELNNRYSKLKELVNNLKLSKNDVAKDKALANLSKQLKEWKPRVAHTDMERLPWGIPENKVREPIVEKTQNVNKVNYRNYHSNSAIGEWRDTEYQIANYFLNKKPIQTVNNINGMTSAGNWPVLKSLPKDVQSADLVENEDVQITDEIKDLAAELDNSPAKIFKWVHDNIYFVPTYGSIQGSALTLETKRGNSADTASLLIALLRASNIPARYVYGTVDVPADFAMNWVGGVSNIGAAQNLLGQGGVPNVAIMNGSVPEYLRMEHVWVEANVDYIGSRGALNSNKTQNNVKQWVPLDASYKSYTRTEGKDFSENVSFDAEKFIDDAKAGADINEAQGSVKDLNIEAINTAVKNYQTDLLTYLKENNPDATVSDLLGTVKINEYKSTKLPSILPYKVKTVVGDYYQLPNNMRHFFILKTYASKSSYSNYVDYSNPLIDIKIPTTKLRGKAFALSFKPATESDVQKIKSLLPNDGSGITPDSYPSTIKMSPELTLESELLATNGVYNLGDQVNMRYGIESPNSSLPSLVDKIVTAGEYHAIGYNLQGISQEQVERTNQKLEKSNEKLAQYQDDEIVEGLSKHELTGALMQANVQSYFATNQAQSKFVQNQLGVISSPYMSFGTFSDNLQTETRYGVPVRATSKGVVMDIDRILNTAIDKDNNQNNVTEFNLKMGPLLSLNENAIPEQIFDDKDTPEKEANGISAAKALQIAAQRGQTIFTINKDNYSSIVSQLNHDSVVMTDIRNAINAGKQVTVHDTKLSYSGWSGTGYIVIDTNTGAGGYLIGGGADGGYTDIGQKLDKIISWLSAFEVKVAKPFKKIISQIKKFFKNIKAVIDIIEDCPAQLQLLGIGFYIVSMWIAYKVIAFITAATLTISSAICGLLFCQALVVMLVLPILVSLVNNVQEMILNDILTGCRGE